MASTPLIAATAPLTQPTPGITRKDQKGFQLGQAYSAQEINAEFDRLHRRINDLVVEDPAQTDLKTDGTETNANICLRINAIMAAMRKAHLLKT